MIQDIVLKAFDLYNEKTAIKYRDTDLSYKELEIMSKKIANMIIEREYGDIVAIYSTNCLFIIASIIGVLLSRRAFVILSHDEPWAYNKEILNTLECKNLLDDSTEYDNYSCILEEILYEPEDKIYIYPTSGSTGSPKLVVGKNKGLAHFINWQTTEFNIGSNTRFLRLIPYTHDPALRDIFTPLCSGGEIICLDSRYDVFEPKKLQEYISNHNITHLHCTPSMLRIITSKIYLEDSFKSIINIFLSGEEALGKDIKKMLQYNNKIQFVNFYGPTETNMIRLFHRISNEDIDKDNIPIGNPIWDTFYRIIKDEEGNNILYLSTEYGTHGYYNHKKDEDFIILDDGRLYFKTGDIVEEINGKIYYIGRKDYQIKIRGNRVNLNEIRIRIQKILPSASIIVINHNINDVEKIYAFIKDKKPHKIDTLKQKLLDSIPSYMVPNKIIQLDDFPLNKNGKLDRKKLTEIYIGEYNIKEEITSKRSVVRELWKSILNLDDVGDETDFFLQGADSLTVVRLMVELESRGLSIDVIDIFEKRKFKAILESIKIDKEEKTEMSNCKLELLPIHKQIIKVAGILQNKKYWNMINIFELKERVNIEKLKQLIEEIIFASDVFKIKVCDDNKIEVGINHGIKIESVDFGNKDIEVTEMVSRTSELNIFEGHLGEILIFENKASQFICCNFHHLVFDNKSMDIFIKRLNNILKGKKLPNEKSYIDFMKKRIIEINKDENYWINRGLEKYNFELPTINRANKFEYNSRRRVKKTIHKEYSNFMVLVAALSISIYKNTGKGKMGFHTFLDIRNQYLFEDTIGLFTHEAIILNEVKENTSINEVLDSTRKEIILALEKHRYDKNQILGKLMSRNSIIINYEKYERIEDNIFKKIYSNNTFSHYSLAIEAKEYDEFIDIDFIFKDKKTEENISEYLVTDVLRIYDIINSDNDLNVEKFPL